MVGCVLVRNDQVIGEGWHQRYGGPHAEVEAVRDAKSRGNDVAGATVYVTLEPCSHFGKTPPCADMLIEARVARVVAAMADPFPEVSGRGLERMRQAGIDVEVGVGQREAREQLAPYLKRVQHGLPWVIAKWAQTLDGKIATATGHSQWISNPASRRRVHELRGRVDAILVGVGTVIADDPSLTARKVEVKRVARRLVADRSGRMPQDAKMLHDGGPPVTVLRGSLKEELQKLAAEGVTNVLVEGGAHLAGALLNEGLIDELRVYVAPSWRGTRPVWMRW